MNALDAKRKIDALGDIDAKMPRDEGNAAIGNLAAFRALVAGVKGIPGVDTFVSRIEQSPAYQSKQPSVRVADDLRHSTLLNAAALRDFLKSVQAFIASTGVPDATESDIFVRFAKADDLPTINGQLATLQKILEQTILDPKISGKLVVKSIDRGSIWIHLCLGSVAAVSFVGAMAWAAAVVYKKYQEARLVEMHVDALEIRNDALEDIRQAQRKMLKGVVEAEARHLEKEYFDGEENPERLERIKHSIKQTQELIENGAEVHPALLAPENVKNLFPDFKQLENVTSRIKQITEKAS